MPRPPKKSVDAKTHVGLAVPPPMMPGLANPAVAAAGILPPVPLGASMGGMPSRVVDNDSFLRVRDSAVGRLTTILELLRSFTADYVRQTNLLLGEPTADLGQGDLLNFENAAGQLLMPMMPDMVAPLEEKKERKKRTHDPNAPKRPLTPYFLYMQHARSIIANDLGAEAPKGAVQEEGQRRWANMSPHEKQGWNNAYQYNLRLYNARVHSYKNGNPLAKNMSDDEALKYAEEFSIPMPEIKDAAANDQAAIAQQLQAPGAEDDKTPKKGGPRKRKTDTPAIPTEVQGTPASPDKKRRRTSGKVPDDKDEPKKAARGKKAKSS